MKQQKHIFDIISLECSKKTTKVYSTSFSLAIKLLSKEYQNAIYSIYGFVRLADEIVDSFHDYNKTKLLNELKYSTIDALEKNIILNPIINSFQNVVKKYNIEWVLIESFLDSMEYDLTHQNCNEQNYKKYIQGSAEAVGLMCLQVFTHNKKGKYSKLKKHAASLGSAFQKINFLRDMHEDYNSLNRVYFPNLDPLPAARIIPIIIYEKNLLKIFISKSKILEFLSGCHIIPIILFFLLNIPFVMPSNDFANTINSLTFFFVPKL